MRPAALAATTYTAWIFAAGFVLGTVRLLVLVPRMGTLWAEAIEVPVMLALSFWVARWRVERHGVLARLADRLLMGGLAFVLLLCAEAALSVVGFGQTLTGFLRGYVDPQKWIGLAGQIAFALMPALLLMRGRQS